MELLGLINDSACYSLLNLHRKISLQSVNDREASFLFQRLSILIQQFNAILLHHSFVRRTNGHSSLFA